MIILALSEKFRELESIVLLNAKYLIFGLAVRFGEYRVKTT
jgi:hypothetical protein